MASLVDARTATVNQKRLLCPVVSRKSLFALMTGVCLLGIFILTFYTRLGDVSPKWVYDTVSNLTGYRNMDVLTFIWSRDDYNSSSIVGQSSYIRLPDFEYQKGNISAIPAPKISGILQDQTTAPATVQASTLAEVQSITTTMTFNKSLEVRCKESPYIECAPPVIKKTSEKVFKVTLFNQPSWQPLSSLNVPGCRYNKCQFVESIVTKKTDLVVVNGMDITGSIHPPESWSHKLVANCGWEPPVYYKSHLPAMANSPWNNRFNFTMTYRLDSDIFSPYGRIKFNPKPLWQRPNYHEIAKKKTKTVVWVVSHCRTYSKRERYVKEMQKYIDVDILGACGQPCSTKRGNCISSDYKFYLAFENTLCDDYVTEKFFKLFRPGMHVIPVVRGGADYDKYFPNFTYINAAHFKTAKDLALHLKDLASDLETYSKYLEYKDIYVLSVPTIEMVCNICEYLHTRNGSNSKTYNFKSWIVNGHCRDPTDL